MTWGQLLVNVVGALAATVGSYLGSSVAGTGNQEIGVQSLEQQSPMYNIINSTNVRLTDLADQHNRHTDQVQQYMVVGLISLAVISVTLVVIVICGCVCGRRLHRRIQNQPTRNQIYKSVRFPAAPTIAEDCV